MAVRRVAILALVAALAAGATFAQPLTAEETGPVSEGVRTSMPGALAILFGAFCALWAQNTGRNPWLWFFAGAIFNVITVLILLSKNAKSTNTPQVPGSSSSA